METEMNLWQAIKAVMEGELVEDVGDYGYMRLHAGQISWFDKRSHAFIKTVELDVVTDMRFCIYDPRVDGTKVPVDTPVWVWDTDARKRKPAYFALYLPVAERKYYVFENGGTSSNAPGVLSYKNCKLRMED